MRVVEPNAEVIEERDPFKLIEIAGRLCYKTEDKITENSCYDFVDMLISKKHYAMLEHGHAHFLIESKKPNHVRKLLDNIPYAVWDEFMISNTECGFVVTLSISHLFNMNVPKLEVNSRQEVVLSNINELLLRCRNTFITCYNEGVLFSTHEVYANSAILDSEDIYSVQLIPESELQHYFKYFNANRLRDHIFTSIKFICDRGVSHELVRHRISVAQESQRYCNYSKDRFGDEITFIKPVNIDKRTEAYLIWLKVCAYSETSYFDLLNSGLKPQDARSVLPNSTKTEVILTANCLQWEHFFDLRSKGTTGTPHPDMKVVADIALEKYNSHIKNLNN